MMGKSIIKETLFGKRTGKEREISIKKIDSKKEIRARFEDCDDFGIIIVLEKDKKPVINDYCKIERKTFIPWHRINEIKFL